ncbi:ATPase associated with various cellular activities [Desulfosarcina cetonica]|nr:ATPase associated with various cellular activities [Desulfosarcina cetonica]
MQKKKELFRPEDYKKDLPPESTVDFGERGKGQIYVWDEKTVFAVQVAQITERPLLLRGPAGSGKSSLAPFVAITLDHAFYPFTVTARTQARDMLWGFDALGRLNDANVSRVDEDAQKRVTDCRNYLTPGPLWWAFDPQNASRRGTTGAETSPVPPAKDPAGQKQSKGAVVLIDEIDKADPDVPNNLLEVLGSHRFTVHETGDVIRDRRSPLVIITTNEERELPGAFLRRCVVLHLTEKTADQLVTIAEKHYGGERSGLYEAVAQTLVQLRHEAEGQGHRPPSTAEFLDAIRACIDLDIQVRRPGAGEENADAESAPAWKYWDDLVEMTLTKRPAPKQQTR